ncbi:hypothetical protein ACF0H5_018067 [Mactra antiquata]
MWNNLNTILAGILLLFCVGNFAIKIDHQFPLGTIGCLFTNSEDICDDNAKCIDDLLFGTCAYSGIPANFVYTLTKHDLLKLEEEILKLVHDGFTWRDGYTQCIVQNIIISLSIKQPFSKTICYGLIFERDNGEENALSSMLDDVYANTNRFDRINNGANFNDLDLALLSPSQKRDEIVRVHKYFDKNEKIHKRNFWSPYNDEETYLSPDVDLMRYGPQNLPQDDEGWENTGIPYKDLALVQEYLETQRKPYTDSKILEALMNNGPLVNDVAQVDDDEVPLSNEFIEYPDDTNLEFSKDDLQPGYVWDDDNMLYGLTTQDYNDISEVNDDINDTEESNDYTDPDLSLPPKFANIFDKLIRGEIEPDDLTDEELNYLSPYVSKLLQSISDTEDDSMDDLGPVDALNDVEIDGLSQMDFPMEANMVQDPPFGIDEEEMMMGGSNDDVYDDGDNGDFTDVQTVEKKSDDEIPEKTKEDVVDTKYAYIEMDKNLDADTEKKLLDKLEDVSNANPGSLHIDNTIQGHKVVTRVDPELSGLQASELAQTAKDHKSELEEATGLNFVSSGLGHSENEIEYKGTSGDDRYFVLTFVLCGCIALILLAVVVIYLIRRNSRSKEKLQQITAPQEGNEAASKDYQDLCRQRMQSKSSEKPEPLHTAASRVSSVSEQQVRSPSSRSSTSSWSEEPVNSNMDISTGHIVLSYMEDHLKNKDRLDREWEAMCAYEADPSNTKVAEDASNVRKNRYADVLPYDHSRVVLTTNTNVSGADYINASTITDHDPRNPAYVATQGPLPHTVADFWQMVWEQGSVVIVMLTKLTENGEAKCHRYWPEEGSDLYHIYEVHLVSEHIWCEDYLVRSFYLKNLQTGETRTVTQFHFLTWQDLGIPSSIKALLDFRRKVNKSYRGRSCPIVVHCSDGCGRTGTYCLIDMVLNRMAKGAKEIDIAATLEHIRDQRINMVKTKEQFQFALAAVAEEVHAILKALPQ